MKKLHNFILLFLGSAMCIHALGEIETEEQKRMKLEQYPIKVAPISLPGTIGYDYVFINKDTIFLSGRQLFEVNLTTDKWKEIETPKDWTANYLIRELKYDKTTNSVHMLYIERNQEKRMPGFSYYILHLDDYSWEGIDELGINLGGQYWYDSQNKYIYVLLGKMNAAELEERKLNSGGDYQQTILKFDLDNREVLEYIELPHDTSNIYCMYGSPLKILASTPSKQIPRSHHFFIYDVSTRTRADYPESIFVTAAVDADFISLRDYIPINGNGCFLGIEDRTQSAQIKNSIALMDLNLNTLETVALKDFPYEMNRFKEIDNGKYSFLVRTLNWAGGASQSFLCFLDYP
jgi:hypothetical protein